ncbi:glycosyltransferase family 4 protein [Acidomonas methanolica]|uniref:glycosyltransferase family 4 protein n=1 Tax=Acidomonas methanolica TaxID=437 RepID=UPI002119FB9D|nr:glycosyltransferase family 1 protein [Acidomonas methanolica]MCQ9154134.1 glycosyltransferase family 4 protein [Acidomonas methanolica]
MTVTPSPSIASSRTSLPAGAASQPSSLPTSPDARSIDGKKSRTRLWIDVEDLFQYASNTSRPSGIQRLAFEVQRALVALAPDEVRFVRHSGSGRDFVSVRFAELEALFDGLTDTVTTPPAPPPETPEKAEEETAAYEPPPLSLARRLRHRIMTRLPPDIARGLRHYRVHQLEAIRYLRDMIRDRLRRRQALAAASGDAASGSSSASAEAHARQDTDIPFRTGVAPGDWLVCLGSPWFLDGYADLIANTCARHDMRFALLLYDIIPLRRPEWCDRNLVKAFRNWFQNVLPLADVLLSISRTTALDVERYVAETGLSLRAGVRTIPLGTGFGRPPVPEWTGRLPPRRSFALIVSTIEARKNHLLLFRIWRELLDVMPREKVPTLVFAGRVGWLVADLMQQLKNADWLDGKILLVEAPSDGELAALYEDCLFTLYPSLYEGWGLPVTESLAHGTPCLAADKTSIPEAGGTLARYFDPDNLHDALRAVREILDDPATLDVWRTQIRETFRDTPGWNDSAAAILDLLHGAARDARTEPC